MSFRKVINDLAKISCSGRFLLSRPGASLGENIHLDDSPSGVVMYYCPFVQSARTSDYDGDSVSPRITRPLESEGDGDNFPRQVRNCLLRPEGRGHIFDLQCAFDSKFRPEACRLLLVSNPRELAYVIDISYRRDVCVTCEC